MADPRIRYDVLANAEGGEDVRRLAAELEKLDDAFDPAVQARAKALAEQLRELGARDDGVQAFTRLKRETDAAAKALEQAQQAAQELGREIAATATPTRAQAGEFERLRDAVKRAETELLQKTQATIGARAELAKLGISTTNLADTQVQLQASTRKVREEVAQLGQQGEARGARHAYNCGGPQRAAAAVLHCPRTCTAGVGVGSPENTGARPPQERPFLRVNAMVPCSTAARAGAPSGAPVPVFRSSNPALGCHPRLEARAVVLDRNTGAFTMAGYPMGALPPASPSPLSVAGAAPRGAAASTRRRLNHAVLLAGNEMASVYSARSAATLYSVSLEFGAGTLSLASSMTPAQARNLARALVAAAAAADQARQGGAQ